MKLSDSNCIVKYIHRGIYHMNNFLKYSSSGLQKFTIPTLLLSCLLDTLSMFCCNFFVSNPNGVIKIGLLDRHQGLLRIEICFKNIHFWFPKTWLFQLCFKKFHQARKPKNIWHSNDFSILVIRVCRIFIFNIMHIHT